MDVAKADLRRQMRALRDALAPSGGGALAAHLLHHLGPVLPPVIGGFLPIGSEIDLGPAMTALRRRGAAIALPVTPRRGEPLIFRLWPEGATLLPGRFGTSHPDGTETVPSLLLVPLLAFDRHCHRLGYGGGYYDRTLAAHPGIRTIGCAYAAQRVQDLPVEPTDMPLDAVVTERGLFLPER